MSVTAYHSFSGEVEASNTPTIRRLIPSCRHQLSPIALQALRLDRVPSPYIAELLTYLTKGTPDAIVIENPEAGWNRLRDRILRDISHEDVVLPQQLKIILGGIQHLKRLNVAEYERIGGAGGVEALYVQQQISGTARKVGLEPGQVRAMLASGTDRPS